MVDVGFKAFSCAFLPDVFCSFRKDGNSVMMERCLKCVHHAEFLRLMQKEDEDEDAEFLLEFERVNKDAKCQFVGCLCDGEHGKLACFTFNYVGSNVNLWTCPRFCLEKLPVHSVMRLEYVRLVGGVAP